MGDVETRTLRYVVAVNETKTRMLEAWPVDDQFALTFATRSEPDALWGPPIPVAPFVGDVAGLEEFFARRGYPAIERVWDES